MKLKLLFFFLITTGFLNAQDTIRNLVITEAFIGRPFRNHAEITNMGNEPIQLSQFKFGQAQDSNFTRNRGDINLPDYLLQPGESYLITEFCEWMVDVSEEPWSFNEREMMGMPKEWAGMADIKYHQAENSWGQPLAEHDSVSPVNIISNWWGRSALFLEQQFPDGSGVVIDQVGGVWDYYGRQRGLSYEDSYSVAGFENATSQARLIRKYSVKQGNIDFATGRGVDADDSEWIAIPFLLSVNRMQPFTLKNHGDYNLDENTLEPAIAGMSVDLAGRTITVPWGLRKPDDIMANMNKKPGVAWYYYMNSNYDDSLSYAVKSGDKLEVLVTGSDLDRATFDIVVSDPLPSENSVIPGIKWDPHGNYRDDIKNNFTEWPVVTRNESEIDTIRGYKTQHYNDIPNPDYYYGIPFDTPVDTLLKILEKPSNASWKIVWVDGVKRTTLKNGDKLKITAENGNVKEYYIKVDAYRPAGDATLSAITWPDIPDFYYGIFGWEGDTIPNFLSYTYDYLVEVPFDVEGIPALIPKTTNNNATVQVARATNLHATIEERTYVFTVTAEDGISTSTYHVRLEKEKHPQDVEPYQAEPFLSKMMVNDQYGNSFAEICNPGNQPIDLSDYMFVENYGNPDPKAAVQKVSGTDDWFNRFSKYVPGYKWVSEAEWQIKPGILVQELNVNSIVMPRDVFVLGEIQRDNVLAQIDSNYNWNVPGKLDVQFRNTVGEIDTYNNPWGEEINAVPIPQWSQSCWFMFKILNDSVKWGLKPANDPSDFELIDTWGMADGSTWTFSDPQTQAYGSANLSSWVRRPEYAAPNPVMGASFGTLPEECEWIRHDDDYWRDDIGIPYPLYQAYAPNELGYHYLNPPTENMSTVGSNRYKVSPGYGADEEIQGVITGTTVNEFLSNIIKYDEGQKLKVKNNNGFELTGIASVSLNDTLVVISADSTNTTWYALKVGDNGLNSDAVLTSGRYDVTILELSGDTPGTGTISGFEYGTQLKTILDNINIPGGASLNIIDEDGKNVPLKLLNFDTVYIYTTVSHNFYFEVVAEDMTTKIVYQLLPQSSASSAFVTSNYFNVDQGATLIQYVPGGEYVAGGAINIPKFLDYLIPVAGASVKLVDKFGMARTEGEVHPDDMVVVTSADGNVNRVYYISFLANPFNQQVTHPPYALSNVYSVNQLDKSISGIGENTLVSDFLSRIFMSAGATGILVDAHGNPITSSQMYLNHGDLLKATGPNGEQVVHYFLKVSEPGCSQHFRTVWEGTAGVDHMNINTIEAKLDGVDLEPGDEVGVFDGNLCVGYGKVVQTITNQNILSIVVSRNDGNGNGYTSGNEISYMLWDCSKQSEYPVKNVQCFDNQLNSVTCSPFEAGATAFVKLSASGEVCQTLTFSQGWNMFSSPNYPPGSDMKVLFQPTIDKGSLVKIQDELGNSLEDWGIFGGWKNNIGNISPTEGYKIKVNMYDSLKVCGTPVEYPFAIPLKAGWNIMGYPQTAGYNGIDVVQQLINRGTLIKVQDEMGNSIEDWGIFGGWQNNIGDFMPGEGYKIKVNADDILTINSSYPKSTTIVSPLAATQNFIPAYEGNGVDHMNINIVALPVNLLHPGDELAVFDGDLCVGAATILAQHLENQGISLVASAADCEGIAGFTEGNSYKLYLWKPNKKQEYELLPELIRGSNSFEKHESSVLSLEKYAVTGLEGPDVPGLTEVKCYPNPFSDALTVEIRVRESAKVAIEVINQSGQPVNYIVPYDRLPAGTHYLSWNGLNSENQKVSAGFYYLKINVDGIHSYHKVVLSK